MRGISWFVFISVVGVAQVTFAQPNALIESINDRFFEECLMAINAPSDYIEEARTRDSIEVIESNDGNLFYVHHTAPPGEFVVQFGQASPNHLRVFCHAAQFNHPQLMDSDSTEVAMDNYIQTRSDLLSAGGAIDMANPIAGRSSETGEMMRYVATQHYHLINGWSASDHIAQVAIQINMYEIWAEIVLNETLDIVESPRTSPDKMEDR